MNRLAVFDIDGTLTDTNGVDDEAYRAAVAAAIDVAPELIDWSGALHVTDAQIFRYLCERHGRGEPSVELTSRARSAFVERLSATLSEAPDRFAEMPGARDMLRHLADQGWCVALATGGWGASARLKLRAAGLAIDDSLIVSADDGMSRADIVRLANARAESFYARPFHRVVSIGDGVWDVETAAALGLPFIGIARGARHDRLRAAGASVVFPDYCDIEGFSFALGSATVPGFGS